MSVVMTIRAVSASERSWSTSDPDEPNRNAFAETAGPGLVTPKRPTHSTGRRSAAVPSEAMLLGACPGEDNTEIEGASHKRFKFLNADIRFLSAQRITWRCGRFESSTQAAAPPGRLGCLAL